MYLLKDISRKSGGFILLFLLMNSLISSAQTSSLSSKENKAKVRKILASMTQDEKIKMLVGIGFALPGMPKGILPPIDPADDTIPYKVPGTSGRMHGLPRKGIPVLTLADGPAGVHIWDFGPSDKVKFCTSFPNASLLSSTWDTALIKNVGIAFGNEAKEYGIDILLGPAMNIHRDPLNGRNFEYYSEDPVLSGNISAAMVNGIQQEGEGVSVKHFVANNSENNRNKLNTIVSQRAMREIYLRGFEITVKKSNPWTIMSSYNKVNGTYVSEDKEILTDVLRKEWGYKGFVMTDWFGGTNAVAQINAGNNLLMPGTYAQLKTLRSAVLHDSITKKTLDENVEQILNVILLSPIYNKYPYSNKPDLKAHALVSRTAATEGMVLLKNEGNTLPLNINAKIALFGNPSYDLIAGGTGSGDVTRAYTVSLYEGLQNSGFTIEDFSKDYLNYLNSEKAKRPKPSLMSILNPPPPIKELVLSDSTYASIAKKADLGIFTIGRNAGEGKDRVVENDFNLTLSERSVLQKLSYFFHAQNKKFVVVINAGGIIETASWRDYADAILLAWQPGMEGGNAMADVLSGKVNPSGKLPSTFPLVYEDVSSSKNFPGKELVQDQKKGFNPLDQGVPAEITYEEGIYVGYRYFNTFKVKPAYEFGFGLSYTHFNYADLKLSSPDFNGKITASVTITNSGKYAGKEVAQLYLTAPKGSLDKPSEELKGFGKTRLLQPGESETLSFTLYPKDLASFNTQANAWIADSGDYTVKIGASSEDIKATLPFHLEKSLEVEKVNNVMIPQVKINELKHL